MMGQEVAELIASVGWLPHVRIATAGSPAIHEMGMA